MPRAKVVTLLVEDEPLCQECHWERKGRYAEWLVVTDGDFRRGHGETLLYAVSSKGVHVEETCARHADEALREEADESREDAAEEVRS